MSNKPENPRAFPLPVSDNNMGYEGMTLRDYFAAAALNKCIDYTTAADDDGSPNNPHNTPDELAGLIANYAYAIADAMLEERQS